MFFIYGLICLCVVHAMITDVKYRRIYNYNSAIIISLSVLLFFFSVKLSLFVPFMVLIIGFLLFVLNFWGAGDAKLSFALTLSLPTDLMFIFLLLMSISGGVIATFMLVFPRLKGKFVSVPYALSIGIGYFLTLIIGVSNDSIVII
ncbi:A24 family peptidase [Salmonella enterica]|uniref:Prepilin type IV endopeptidase peptidase domain-containing protein n=2 Tax=Salmonella enterica TaxID=28901 RepID=A0A722XTP4_SALER|nr:hypothetical protein [Salmonella enterica subsp. enterica]EGI5216543.1 hypothetical protein [Salmonella enterica subsp. enterica serovar Albany]EIL0012906.1 prepilin peptidase [Salmonella enterica]HBN1189091.1 prepilin peptidase [Salmonella enterica subsp. enterica serovar Schwarzengrund]EDW1263007.1 hypothetical protein [Salmonella enterica subsp. enterica]